MARKTTAVTPKTAKVTAPKAKIATSGGSDPAARGAADSKTVTLTAVPKPATEAPKPAPATAPKPAIAQAATPVEQGAVVKKPDFLDKAVLRSGVKRRDAKPAIEAALDEIAEILGRGDELNLPPLGKLKVVKTKDLNNGAKALTLKLRTMKTT